MSRVLREVPTRADVPRAEVVGASGGGGQGERGFPTPEPQVDTQQLRRRSCARHDQQRAKPGDAIGGMVQRVHQRLMSSASARYGVRSQHRFVALTTSLPSREEPGVDVRVASRTGAKHNRVAPPSFEFKERGKFNCRSKDIPKCECIIASGWRRNDGSEKTATQRWDSNDW